MELATLIPEIEKIENAWQAADAGHYGDLASNFWEQRRAMNMAATYFIPKSRDDAAFLHGLIDELVEFVDDGPNWERDRELAIEAIERMNDNLRNFTLGN